MERCFFNRIKQLFGKKSNEVVGFICFVLSSQSYLSEGEKKDSFASSLFLYEKENIEIVLTGVQLKKKCIDFRAMSDKILTRKSKRTEFQEGK